MAETSSGSSIYMMPHLQPVAPAEARVNTTITEAARTELKTSVHNDLIKRMDLQKLGTIQADTVGGRQRLLAIIHQYVGEQTFP